MDCACVTVKQWKSVSERAGEVMTERNREHIYYRRHGFTDTTERGAVLIKSVSKKQNWCSGVLTHLFFWASWATTKNWNAFSDLLLTCVMFWFDFFNDCNRPSWNNARDFGFETRLPIFWHFRWTSTHYIFGLFVVLGPAFAWHFLGGPVEVRRFPRKCEKCEDFCGSARR